MQPTSTSLVAEPAHAEHGLSASSPEQHTACLNCGHRVTDHFCGHCGQSAHTHRLTVGHLLHEVSHTLHVEKGLFYTTLEMLRRPADTIRRYLAGQRQPHFRPLGYVLLAAGASSVLFLFLHIQLYAAPDARFPPALTLLMERVTQQATQYQGWLMAGLLPFMAALTWVLLRRLRFNYAEHLVLNAYLAGSTTVLYLPFIVLMYFFNGTATSQLISQGLVLLMLAYATWVYGGLLKPTGGSRFRRYARGLLTAVLALVVQMTLSYAVLFAFNWPLVKQVFR